MRERGEKRERGDRRQEKAEGTEKWIENPALFCSKRSSFSTECWNTERLHTTMEKRYRGCCHSRSACLEGRTLKAACAHSLSCPAAAEDGRPHQGHDWLASAPVLSTFGIRTKSYTPRRELRQNVCIALPPKNNLCLLDLVVSFLKTFVSIAACISIEGIDVQMSISWTGFWWVNLFENEAHWAPF